MRALLAAIGLSTIASCQGNIAFEDIVLPSSSTSSFGAAGAAGAGATASSSAEAVAGSSTSGLAGGTTSGAGLDGPNGSSSSGVLVTGTGGAIGSSTDGAPFAGTGGATDSGVGGAPSSGGGGIATGGTGGIASSPGGGGAGFAAGGAGGAGGTSSASCTDRLKDGGETDIDCGGGICPSCGLTERCALDADCASNACDVMSSACVPSQCIDHRQDGDETDVDCGGANICLRCAAKQKCKVAADCTTNICDALSQVCILNQCSDHQQDGTETDIDCGGSGGVYLCLRCKPGKQCNGATDCIPGHLCSTTTPHVCL